MHKRERLSGSWVYHRLGALWLASAGLFGSGAAACGDAFSSDCLITRTCPAPNGSGGEGGQSQDDGGAAAGGDLGLAGAAAAEGGVRNSGGGGASAAGAGVEPSASGAGGAAGSGNDGPVCGDGVRTGTEAEPAGCDDRNARPGDGCSDTCTREAGWDCDAGEPTTCTSICGDGLVVGGEALAGACDDGGTATADGCGATCKVEPGYVCHGEPSKCAKTCGNGKLGDGETCEDGNQVSGDGCFACAVEQGFSCDSATLPSKCADINECTPGGGNNCSEKATCTNKVGSFTCKCKSGYSGDGVTCDDIDECKENTDNCNANATCTNSVGSYSCACNNGYWGSGVTCAPNPSIISFTADYSRVCSGGAVTFSATYKNGTGSIDQGVGSIVSGKTAVSGAITGTKLFQLTVSAAGGTPATAQVTVDTIAHGTFALTKNVPASVDSSATAAALKLKDGRALIFATSASTGRASAQIFDPHDETFALTTLSSESLPTFALLNDGRVLVAALGDSAASASIYNPLTNTSAATGGAMSQARGAAFGLALGDGRILIAGGLTEASGVVSVAKTSELFDPTAMVNGSFGVGPNMSSPRLYPGVGMLPNSRKVLVAGGCAQNSDVGYCTAYTATADLYDPTVGKSGAFLKAGSMSAARFIPASVALADDRVLIAGGVSSVGSATAVKTAELFDPRGGDPQNGIFGSFQVTGSMLTARVGPSATLLKDGRVLVAGGSSGGTSFKSSELYDPKTGSFTLTGDMSYARALHGAVLLDNGMVLVGPDHAELYCP